jgi:O-antigen ligase
LAVVFVQPQARRLRAIDWAVLLVLMLEAVSLLSRSDANGVSSARVVVISGLLYFLARIVSGRPAQYLVASVVVAAGGVGLACFAMSQFSGHFQELHANGFSGAVAFRYRLIAPPSPWVLGEWFTLLLMTLPFAFAVVAFLWAVGRRKLAAISIFPVLAIATALGLSCSRAVFWGVAVFFVAVFAVAAVYRVVPVSTAAISAACALCMLAALVLAENALYSGVLKAYAGGHTSQARSTEGRLAIWKRSAEVFKQSPLWGVGSGNAPLFLTSSADQEETTGFASRTFSLPVQLLTEKGVIGTAVYLAVLVLAGLAAHRKLRSPKVSLQMKGLTCCLLAGVIAVLFRELTYSSLLEHAATAMLFAMSLALLAGEEPA